MSPLFAATEDFSRKTLEAIPGTLGKLRYVASLRTENGEYHHWGLIRIYGERGAQQALGEAHRELVLQVLRTPLRELLEDVALSSKQAAIAPQAYVAELRSNVEQLLPSDLRGGSVHHFNTVLQALSALSGMDASRRVS